MANVLTLLLCLTKAITSISLNRSATEMVSTLLPRALSRALLRVASGQCRSWSFSLVPSVSLEDLTY